MTDHESDWGEPILTADTPASELRGIVEDLVHTQVRELRDQLDEDDELTEHERYAFLIKAIPVLVTKTAGAVISGWCRLQAERDGGSAHLH